jgi:hypothetical protein
LMCVIATLQHGDTALMLACRGGHLALAKWLVDEGHGDARRERRKACSLCGMRHHV